LALATTEGAKEIRSKGVSLDEEVVVGWRCHSHHPLFTIQRAEVGEVGEMGEWQEGSQVLFCIVFWPFENSRGQLQLSH